MPVPPFVAGSVLTAAQLNTGAYRVASATAAGTATTLQVNNCFTSTYRHYRIYISGYSATAGTLSLQLSFGGTPATASYYSNRTTLSYTVANTTAFQANTANIFIGQMNNGSLLSNSNIALDVLDPFVLSPTGFYSFNQYSNANANLTIGTHYAGTSYDGFKLTGAGNLTLDVSIYGFVGA